MSQKNETTVLVLAFLITAALVAGGFWWFTNKSGLKFGDLSKPSSSSSTSQTPISSSNPSGQSTSESFAQVQDVPSGLFSYGGSTSWAPIRGNVDQAIQKAQSKFQLRYLNPTGVPPSSGAGIKMLLDSELTFAQSSRPLLDQEYNQAKQRGFSLQQIPVAIDGLAIAVNPSLNISGLTLDQLKSIYTGKITNWQQLGGPNVPVKPYSRPSNSGGTVELFVEDILGGQPFGKNVEFVSTTTEALRRLISNAGGIYFASAPEVVPQCKIKPLPIGRQASNLVPPYQEPFVSLQECPTKRNQLNIDAFQKGQYPITRNLFVIVKQNGQIEQQAGVAYANLLLSTQGQELIAKAGFVRIR